MVYNRILLSYQPLHIIYVLHLVFQDKHELMRKQNPAVHRWDISPDVPEGYLVASDIHESSFVGLS